MNKEMKESKLKVMEALQEEAYKGIVRIDSETMHVIGVRPGDIIEIEGQRKTVGIVDRAYPTDVGQQVIRMDGIIRRNAKTSIGETVAVRKAIVAEAKSITIAPSQQGIMIQASPELFRRGLLGRSVLKGDIISLGGARRRRRTMEDSPFEEIFNVFEEGFMGSFGLPSLKFVVVDSNPKQAVIISENTNITVTQKATEVSDEKIPEVNYEDLGGLEDEIKKVREMVELPLKHPEIFTRLGIEPPSGVLLHGPPGSGKTLLAKAVANESEANFMLINGPEVMNKFYGESEKRIRDIFEEAEKNAPSIIFIDEIDAIAPKREETRGEVERRVVAQLLTMMDGLKSRKNVVVIGATNRPNAIDPALRRPGRFDREISINVPDKKGRLEILKIHSRNMPIEHWDNLIAAKIAKKRIMNFPQEAEKKIAEKNSKISEINTEIKQLNAEITKKIAEKNSKISEINTEIKQLNDDIDKIKLEIRRLEQQKTIVAESQFRKLVQLLSFKKDELTEQEDLLKTKVRESKNFQEKIIAFEEETKNNISKLKQKISDYSKEIENLEIDKEEIKNFVIPKVNRSKDNLDRVVKHLEKVKHSKYLMDINDPRNEFVTHELKEKDKEIKQIIESLLRSGIVSDNLLEEIRKDSKLEMLHYFAEKTHGFVGADLSALTKESAMNVLRKILPDLNLNEKEPISEDVLQKLRVTNEDFNDALKMVRPSAIREVLIEKPNVNWKDIGGLEELKQELKEAVEWPLKHKDAFKRLGIRPPRGILMYGPPGTGKTLLAKAVATESEANFINVKGPSLLNMWVGESERGIRQIFEKARQVAPTIIFFDEIDSIAVRRGLSAGTKVTERMLNTLLAEMDGLQELNDVVVIGATNRPDIIDPALLRPGRFDRIISTQMPNKGSRLEIFNIHTQPMKDVLSVDVNLNKLVELTENYSGADIEAVCREAAMLSLRESIKAKEIKMHHFLQALQKTGPSLSIDDRKRYQEIEEELKMARNTQAKQEIPSYLG